MKNKLNAFYRKTFQTKIIDNKHGNASCYIRHAKRKYCLNGINLYCNVLKNEMRAIYLRWQIKACRFGPQVRELYLLYLIYFYFTLECLKCAERYVKLVKIDPSSRYLMAWKVFFKEKELYPNYGMFNEIDLIPLLNKITRISKAATSQKHTFNDLMIISYLVGGNWSHKTNWLFFSTI